MSDFLDRMLNGSPFGIGDEERKRLLHDFKKTGFAGSFEGNDEMTERRKELFRRIKGGSSSILDAAEERLKEIENGRFQPRRMETFDLPPVEFSPTETESISNLASQLIESPETVKASTENLNVTNAGLKLFMFHCLSFMMGEIITDPSQAMKAKRAIEQSIDRNFPQDSPVKAAAFGYCEKFFESYSTGESLNDTIAPNGELSEVEILTEQ